MMMMLLLLLLLPLAPGSSRPRQSPAAAASSRDAAALFPVVATVRQKIDACPPLTRAVARAAGPAAAHALTQLGVAYPHSTTSAATR